MGISVIDGPVHVNGRLSCTAFSPPTDSVTNTSVPTGANIATTKLVHRYCKDIQQTTGTAVVASTLDVHIARATGALLAVEAAITGLIATGADRTVTVDVHKSTGAAAFATVLSGTIGFTDGSVLRTAVAGTFSSTTLVDGDILRIVVTVAGSAANQAQGLVVVLTFDENPQ